MYLYNISLYIVYHRESNLFHFGHPAKYPDMSDDTEGDHRHKTLVFSPTLVYFVAI